MSEQIPIPTIDQFVQDLDKEPGWYQLGVFLSVSISELAHIEQSHGSGKGIQRCLIELFECFQSHKNQFLVLILLMLSERCITTILLIKYVTSMSGWVHLHLHLMV